MWPRGTADIFIATYIHKKFRSKGTPSNSEKVKWIMDQSIALLDLHKYYTEKSWNDEDEWISPGFSQM